MRKKEIMTDLANPGPGVRPEAEGALPVADESLITNDGGLLETGNNHDAAAAAEGLLGLHDTPATPEIITPPPVEEAEKKGPSKGKIAAIGAGVGALLIAGASLLGGGDSTEPGEEGSATAPTPAEASSNGVEQSAGGVDVDLESGDASVSVAEDISTPETSSEDMGEHGFIIAETPEEAFVMFYDQFVNVLNTNDTERLDNFLEDNEDKELLSEAADQQARQRRVLFPSLANTHETTVGSVDKIDDRTYTVAGTTTILSNHLDSTPDTYGSTLTFELREMDDVTIWVAIDRSS